MVKENQNEVEILQSIQNYLTDLEESILRIVGNCNSYKDLPNFNVLQMLEQIKKRMLSYDR